MNNCLNLKFLAISENEQLARSCVSAFILPLNPSISELNDIKIVVSEAVTNAIVHGFPDGGGEITVNLKIIDNDLYIEISDDGIGIEDLNAALIPSFSSKEEDHAGMGFTIMKTLTDEMKVVSELNKGTTVFLRKTISQEQI